MMQAKSKAVVSTGINIKRLEQVILTDSYGSPIEPGDAIIIRAADQDVICVYKGIDDGYFVTLTLDTETTNRYRMRTIKSSLKVDPEIAKQICKIIDPNHVSSASSDKEEKE